MMTFRLLFVSTTPINMRERFEGVVFRDIVDFYTVECPTAKNTD